MGGIMRLKNKKTGEIGWLYCDHISIPKRMTVFSEDKDLSANHWDYNSLAELNEEWEDAPEEPKEYWIPMSDEPYPFVGNDWEKEGLSTGLISLSKEENEIKRDKLKAWKRLKDKGFRFDGKEVFSEGLLEIDGVLPALKGADCAERLKIIDDLDLLFGGEE